jgi:streptogramin lyase
MLTYNSFVNNVYYISLAGIYIDHINTTTGDVTVLTLQHKAKEDDGSVANTLERLWTGEWDAGKLALYDPVTDKR